MISMEINTVEFLNILVLLIVHLQVHCCFEKNMLLTYYYYHGWHVVTCQHQQPVSKVNPDFLFLPITVEKTVTPNTK